jgi:hypothetical protein
MPRCFTEQSRRWPKWVPRLRNLGGIIYMPYSEFDLTDGHRSKALGRILEI